MTKHYFTSWSPRCQSVRSNTALLTSTINNLNTSHRSLSVIGFKNMPHEQRYTLLSGFMSKFFSSISRSPFLPYPPPPSSDQHPTNFLDRLSFPHVFPTRWCDFPSRKQAVSREMLVDIGDVDFFVTNNLTNARSFDNACRSGYAGHLYNRLTMLQGLMGGAERMGACVPLRQSFRWMTPRHTRQRHEARWINSADLAVQTGTGRGVLGPGLSPTVQRLLFYPSFLYPNVVSGMTDIFSTIDAFHRWMASHPWDTCGPYSSEMIAYGERQKDTPAAERAWYEAIDGNVYMAKSHGGRKLVLQHITDSARCYSKIYHDNNGTDILTLFHKQAPVLTIRLGMNSYDFGE